MISARAILWVGICNRLVESYLWSGIHVVTSTGYWAELITRQSECVGLNMGYTWCDCIGFKVGVFVSSHHCTHIVWKKNSACPLYTCRHLNRLCFWSAEKTTLNWCSLWNWRGGILWFQWAKLANGMDSFQMWTVSGAVMGNTVIAGISP